MMSRDRITPARGLARRQLLRCASLAAMAAPAGGCVSSLLGQNSEPKTYRLTPKTTFPTDLPDAPWTLIVSEPLADRALDTDRLAFVADGTEIEYVANILWIDRAPSMIQKLIIDSFRAAHRPRAVGSTRDPILGEFLLDPTLRAFQIQGENRRPESVRVGIDLDFVALPDRVVLASNSLTQEEPVAASGVGGVVAAYDAALGSVLKDIVLWTLEQGAQADDSGSG